jgi:hypothetical protein
VSKAATVPAEAPAKAAKSNQAPLLVAILPLLVLFVTAVVLFWLSKQDISGTFRYWEIFVPVVGAISLISGWGQAYLNDNPRLWYLVKQVVSWGALIALLYLLNSQGIRAAISDQQYTAVILYLLAFASLLVAIHMDLKLLVFAVFLVFCAFLIAVPENNPTLLAMGNRFGIADATTKPVMMTAIVACVGFVASFAILLMMRGALLTKRIAAKRRG